MKWLLSLFVFATVVGLCAGLMFVIGCFSVPSLDEGSHGVAVPLLLGFIGFQYGIPLGLLASIGWLFLRSRREKREAITMLRAIDEREVGNTPDEKST